MGKIAEDILYDKYQKVVGYWREFQANNITSAQFSEGLEKLQMQGEVEIIELVKGCLPEKFEYPATQFEKAYSLVIKQFHEKLSKLKGESCEPTSG